MTPRPRIPISRPWIGDEEKAAVVAVLEGGHLVQGARVAAFERAFAAFHGAGHGIATSSGTTALVCALLAHGVGPGDEVILPAFSFFATASCVLAVNATPVFADIDPETFCLSPDAAAAAITPRTRAILPVHLFGHPAELPRFEALCARHGLVLIEDAAQAHGAEIEGRKVGASGTSAFSFHATKNMTTMEGGMVLTNDARLAERLKLLRQHGMSSKHVHVLAGSNYRMTEVAAAMGLVQLERLPRWNAERARHAAAYSQALRGVELPRTRPAVVHAHHLYTVRVRAPLSRDQVRDELVSRGIEARVYYPRGIHEQPVFESVASRFDLPETLRATREVLSIPVFPALTDAERDLVVESVNQIAARGNA